MPDQTHDDAAAAANDAADAMASTRDQFRAGAADLRDKAQAKAEELSAQAADKARDYAEQGKERASGALGEVARLIGENATQLDDKLGSQYGDYARRAAGAVTNAADTLRAKDIDELVEDARDLVRQSPGIAISAAAAAGFFLARIIKSGSEALDASAKTTVYAPPASPEAEISKAARKAGKKAKGSGPAAD